MTELGRKLTTLIEDQDLTLADVALRAGLDEKEIQYLTVTSSYNYYMMTALAQLCRVLGTTVEQLFSGEAEDAMRVFFDLEARNQELKDELNVMERHSRYAKILDQLSQLPDMHVEIVEEHLEWVLSQEKEFLVKPSDEEGSERQFRHPDGQSVDCGTGMAAWVTM
jgi:transcriptional regulator with XRE-family HTH domain